MSGFLLDSYPSGSTIYALFNSFGASGESITLSGLATTDVEIYKNGSVTQRASDNGYALLDTDGTDFDGLTGVHGISIDLSDNSDASFYTIGAQFTVVLSSVTVNSQTVSFVLGSFRIAAAESSSGTPKVDVSHFGGTAGTFSGGRPEVNTTHAAGTAWGSGAITAASIATGAIDADALAADAVAEIADAVWDEDASGHQTQRSFGQTIGDSVADASSIHAYASANFVHLDTTVVPTVGAILADTAEIGAAGAGLTNINLPNQTMDIVGNITGNLSGNVGSVTGAVGSVTGAVGSVTGLTASDVGAIKAKTDSLTFTVAGQVDANIESVNTVTVTGTGAAGDEWGP